MYNLIKMGDSWDFVIFELGMKLFYDELEHLIGRLFQHSQSTTYV